MEWGGGSISSRRAAAGKQLTALLLLAFSRGWKKGKTRIGTEHLLDTMAREMRYLRPIRPGVFNRVWGQVRWRSDDSDSSAAAVDLQVDATLREAAWIARVRLRRAWRAPSPAWTTGVRAAVRRALVEAEGANVRWAHGAHLLIGVCHGTGNRAVEVLTDIGVDPDAILSGVSPRVIGRQGFPIQAAAGVLERTGALTSPRGALRMLATFIRWDAARYRPGGYRPLVMAVDREAAQQAVRLGAPLVGQAHLLLAVCALHNQLDESGLELVPRWAAHNEAGELMAGSGVTGESLVAAVARWAVRDAPAARSRPWRNKTPADPPFGLGVVDIDERAHAYADQLGHSYAGTSHILMALLSDPTGPTHALLRGMGIDSDALASATAARLGL